MKMPFSSSSCASSLSSSFATSRIFSPVGSQLHVASQQCESERIRPLGSRPMIRSPSEISCRRRHGPPAFAHRLMAGVRMKATCASSQSTRKPVSSAATGVSARITSSSISATKAYIASASQCRGASNAERSRNLESLSPSLTSLSPELSTRWQKAESASSAVGSIRSKRESAPCSGGAYAATAARRVA